MTCERPGSVRPGRSPVPGPGGRASRPWGSSVRWAVAAAILPGLLAVLAAPPSTYAQAIKPWIPPSSDSLLHWSSEAKVLFQANTGDSVGGANFRAYERVGLMGRRLVRSLGRTSLLQAHAVGTVIDSLGLDVDVEVDPRSPDFVLLMVRNPYRLTARAVGFIYWYRGDDLRMQGSMFFGGHRPVMRVWWTGYSDQPYSLGILDHERSATGRMRVTLYRMNAAGTAWSLHQHPDEGPELVGGGDAAWSDVNSDGRPELVAWVRAENDTLFESCLSCPYIIHEHTYSERRAGFGLHDMRVLPTPYSTFTLFIRMLAEGNRAGAARLMRDPSRLDEAIAAGWGSRKRARAWKLEYAEEERWPRWLAFLHQGPRGNQRYIVHFELREGRWIIREWLKPRPAGTPAPAPDSGAARRRGTAPGARSSPPARPGTPTPGGVP